MTAEVNRNRITDRDSSRRTLIWRPKSRSFAGPENRATGVPDPRCLQSVLARKVQQHNAV